MDDGSARRDGGACTCAGPGCSRSCGCAETTAGDSSAAPAADIIGGRPADNAEGGPETCAKAGTGGFGTGAGSGMAKGAGTEYAREWMLLVGPACRPDCATPRTDGPERLVAGVTAVWASGRKGSVRSDSCVSPPASVGRGRLNSSLTRVLMGGGTSLRPAQFSGARTHADFSSHAWLRTLAPMGGTGGDTAAASAWNGVRAEPGGGAGAAAEAE